MRQEFYQIALVDRIKELLKVDTHGIFIPFVQYLLRPSQRIVCATSRTEAKAPITELRFIHRAKHLRYGLLDYTVDRSRDAQLARLSVVFGDFDPAYGRRLVFPRQDELLQLCAPEFPVLRQVLYRHPVDTSAPAVRHHLPNRSADVIGRHDEFKKVLLIYLHLHKSVFCYLHKSLHPRKSFGFQLISFWAVDGSCHCFLLSFFHRVPFFKLVSQ